MLFELELEIFNRIVGLETFEFYESSRLRWTFIEKVRRKVFKRIKHFLDWKIKFTIMNQVAFYEIEQPKRMVFSKRVPNRSKPLLGLQSPKLQAELEAGGVLIFTEIVSLISRRFDGRFSRLGSFAKNSWPHQVLVRFSLLNLLVFPRNHSSRSRSTGPITSTL